MSVSNFLEEWKDIKGYEGLYLISNLGRVMSISRIRNNGNGGYRQKSKILNQSTTTTGYKKIELYNEEGKKSIKVHRLVAEMFVPNPYNYKVVNHLDGNPLNNYFGNLEWCTYSENSRHAIENGLKEFFDIDRRSISHLYINKNFSMQEIGDLFGVSATTIKKKLDEYGISKEVVTTYEITDEYLKKQLEMGKSVTKIAKEIGCDQSLISKYKKRIEERGYIYGTK